MSKRGSKSATFIGVVKGFERKSWRKIKGITNQSVIPFDGFEPKIKLKHKALLEKLSLNELQEYYFEILKRIDNHSFNFVVKSALRRQLSRNESFILNLKYKELLKYITEKQKEIRRLEIRDYNIRIIKTEIKKIRSEE